MKLKCSINEFWIINQTFPSHFYQLLSVVSYNIFICGYAIPFFLTEVTLIESCIIMEFSIFHLSAVPSFLSSPSPSPFTALWFAFVSVLLNKPLYLLYFPELFTAMHALKTSQSSFSFVLPFIFLILLFYSFANDSRFINLFTVFQIYVHSCR